MEPERIADYECHTGEGPLWHPDEAVLYWVDIPNGRLFRYDPATGDHEQCHRTDVIGGFTIESDGALLLFEDAGTVRRWDDGDVRTVVDGIPGEGDSRFNDVVADPRGRVFCGTMPTDDRGGRLYRLDVDGSVTLVSDDVELPNGMGFTPDRDRFYFTDSDAHTIYRYEYDAETGELSNPTALVETDPDDGVPDGMTVDAEGCLWSARWDGGRLVRHSPDGEELTSVRFPARKVSSVTFGGPDLTDAYVTTAGGQNRAEEGDGAGATFRFTPGVAGLPEFRSRVASE